MPTWPAAARVAGGADARGATWSELFDTLEMPLVEVLVELESNGIKIDVALFGKAQRRVRPDRGPAGARDSRAGRPAVQHRLAQAIAADPVRRAQAADASRRPRPAAAPTPTCWKSWRAMHPLPAKIIEYRQYAKLKNTYVDALPATGASADRARACVVQPGGGGHGPIELERSELAKHSGPHARAGAKFARRSCRASRAGNCWRPTTRRSSCACWRISRAIRRCCAAFDHDEDIHARVASAGVRRAAGRR